MGIMKTIGSLITGGSGEIVKTVMAGADSLFTSKEEKAAMELKLTEELNRHLEAVAAQATSELELQMKDIDSARSREMAIATSDNAPMLTKIVHPVLAFGTVVLTFVLFYILLFKDVPEGKKDIVIYILGALTAICGQIYSYYFGSSSGSKAKTDQLNKVANKVEK